MVNVQKLANEYAMLFSKKSFRNIIVLPMIVAACGNSAAITISPIVKYGASHSTALEAEFAFYNAWIAAYGQTQCSFSQLTWIENTHTLDGYIPFNNECGHAHALPVQISKVRVCPDKNYTLLETPGGAVELMSNLVYATAKA